MGIVYEKPKTNHYLVPLDRLEGRPEPYVEGLLSIQVFDGELFSAESGEN